MENKLFKGLIDESIIGNFRDKYNHLTYLDTLFDCFPREALIAAAAVFSPVFVEVEGCIFWLAQKKGIADIPQGVGNDKTRNEKHRNLSEVGQFYSWWHQNNEDVENYTDERDEKDWKLSMEIARIIQHFWTLKLKQDFPDREFIFEIGDGSEDFYGEYGVCLTFYEKV